MVITTNNVRNIFTLSVCVLSTVNSCIVRIIDQPAVVNN